MTFAETGYLVRLQPGATISRFHVLGERSSGTNFMKRLLGRNTGLKPTEALGWKHGFPHATGIAPDLLVIGMVRSADAWARSMHTKPWHASPEMQRMEFSEFIRAPWDTLVDRPRYFGGKAAARIVGRPLQHDRHPLTGKRFENIFALRQAKLNGLLSYLERDCTFMLFRMEEATRAPEETLDRVLAEISHPPRSEEFQPVVKRLGAKFKSAVGPRPATPKALSDADLEFLRASVNKAQEAGLGYTY